MLPLLFAALLAATEGAPESTPQSTSESAPRENAGDTIETITVHGRGIELIGEAGAASEGVVGYDDFKDRPLSRVGELVEVIPGAVATQHSGEGKANQYFLRGFNLDHGTDFSASVDGVPVNLRTHGHGQGYLDLNFIIPELVERLDYRKGPYMAETGDFSSAGSARYKTYDRLDRNFAELSVGENGYLRGVAAASLQVGPRTSLLLAGEGEVYDGPWELDQDLKKRNAFAKLIHKGDGVNFSLSASGYKNRWNATDQIPARAVESGLIDRFGAIDDDLGGRTERYGLTAGAGFLHGNGATTDMTAYLVGYSFNLWSNFTYFLDDPVHGDEFEQRDKRTYLGAAIAHERPVGQHLRLKVGGDIRHDDISDIGLFHTEGRARLSAVRQDKVRETSLAAWTSLEASLSDRLRLTVGLRGDYYDASVDAVSLAENGGKADDSLLSPSAALAWRVTDGIELYANYGRGFHSNDVRGATISVDPDSGEAVDPVPILVRSEGAEVGARFEQGPLRLMVNAFWLHLNSELVFVGDAGTTEANDASKRTGVEASLFWKPTPWLVLDAGGAYTDANFDIPGDETRIPGAVKTVLSAGALAHFGPVTVSARLRHFGKAPLIEDGSISSEPTSIVNLGAAYRRGSYTLRLDVLNLFDADDNDISYYFASQLPGEAAPVDDLHFHPVEPRQIRAGLRYEF
jgi:outer membrane receptor protein involved in Fe transport